MDDAPEGRLRAEAGDEGLHLLRVGHVGLAHQHLDAAPRPLGQRRLGGRPGAAPPHQDQVLRPLRHQPLRHRQAETAQAARHEVGGVGGDPVAAHLLTKHHLPDVFCLRHVAEGIAASRSAKTVRGNGVRWPASKASQQFPQHRPGSGPAGAPPPRPDRSRDTQSRASPCGLARGPRYPACRSPGSAPPCAAAERLLGMNSSVSELSTMSIPSPRVCAMTSSAKASERESITCGTPMDCSTARFFGLPAVAKISAPARWASCTAAMPTPPAAAWIRTRSPLFTWARWLSAVVGRQKRHRDGRPLLHAQSPRPPRHQLGLGRDVTARSPYARPTTESPTAAPPPPRPRRRSGRHILRRGAPDPRGTCRGRSGHPGSSAPRPRPGSPPRPCRAPALFTATSLRLSSTPRVAICSWRAWPSSRRRRRRPTPLGPDRAAPRYRFPPRYATWSSPSPAPSSAPSASASCALPGSRSTRTQASSGCSRATVRPNPHSAACTGDTSGASPTACAPRVTRYRRAGASRRARACTRCSVPPQTVRAVWSRGAASASGASTAPSATTPHGASPDAVSKPGVVRALAVDHLARRPPPVSPAAGPAGRRASSWPRSNTTHCPASGAAPARAFSSHLISYSHSRYGFGCARSSAARSPAAVPTPPPPPPGGRPRRRAGSRR